MSAIKAGDLVMVVKPAPCCGLARAVGRVFLVRQVVIGTGYCVSCETLGVGPGAIQPNGCSIHLPRLIKIDPPSIPESIEHKEEMPSATESGQDTVK